MKKIKVPEYYNYVGVFLTFACTLNCSYCVNNYKGSSPRYKCLSTEDWIRGLNRLEVRSDLPITLQGGEPTLHPGFYDIVNGIRKDINIDILTNAMFDADVFMSKIRPERLRRNSKYASIRVSYHMEQMDLDPLIIKLVKMQDNGYDVGVWIVDHPSSNSMVKMSQLIVKGAGIDCRIKEFLGEFNGRLYGTYMYNRAMSGEARSVMCKPSEMLIAPDGGVHRCHYELYNSKKAYEHVLNSQIKLIDTFKKCDTCGLCNPCDIKTKTNRFQEYGHCSVVIR